MRRSKSEIFLQAKDSFRTNVSVLGANLDSSAAAGVSAEISFKSAIRHTEPFISSKAIRVANMIAQNRRFVWRDSSSARAAGANASRGIRQDHDAKGFFT